jgi:hypothetical protein
VDNSSDIGDIDIDVIDVFDNHLWWICNLYGVCLDDEVPLTSETGIQAAELNHHKFAGDTSLDVKFE